MIAVLIAGLMAGIEQDRALIWSDEFDGRRLDPSKWDVAEDCHGGGNSEHQCYGLSNVQLRDGHLVLTARRAANSSGSYPSEPHTEMRSFSSGKVMTKDRASFLYGRIEVRARLAQGQGLWSAIWMLPEHDNYGPYPQSGEIDIAEAVNLGVVCSSCHDRFHGARHHGPNLQSNREESASIRTEEPGRFHIFALEWTPEQLIWLVDDVAYFEAPGGSPWDQRFHLIVNLAVGGAWAEGTGSLGISDNAFPNELIVDYVRVYAPSEPRPHLSP